MATTESRKPRVFIDADVLFAGSASPSEHGASLTILRMAEITLLDALTSEQVIVEAERNLAAKLPATLPTFRLLVDRCLTVVPIPSADEVARHHGLAEANDLPILVAAVQHVCPWLVTFNGRHYRPGHPDVTILLPGEFVQRVRYLLSALNR
ncbi:putative nucleic acid-binding protein, contains PIN domain [Candidatus Promineifilum breve]|uniref:Nucleic acid-binding protein, contains PIN domain n=1 Tax=Candidatus Promineifilum breve TaxID=1806508 RepID=A0A170PIR5_9CHLR|nr:PIN domain-containing protein [Candidatus Promineifilum breve]CUS04993.2 putative nucleic acid-binding protein, contains PIN domain [Candidatus Promineifilum breve]